MQSLGVNDKWQKKGRYLVVTIRRSIAYSCQAKGKHGCEADFLALLMTTLDFNFYVLVRSSILASQVPKRSCTLRVSQLDTPWFTVFHILVVHLANAFRLTSMYWMCTRFWGCWQCTHCKWTIVFKPWKNNVSKEHITWRHDINAATFSTLFWKHTAMPSSRKPVHRKPVHTVFFFYFKAVAKTNRWWSWMFEVRNAQPTLARFPIEKYPFLALSFVEF